MNTNEKIELVKKIVREFGSLRTSCFTVSYIECENIYIKINKTKSEARILFSESDFEEIFDFTYKYIKSSINLIKMEKN